MVVSAPSAIYGQVLLQADFDDKTIDAPIGTGGAAVGEPDQVFYVTAIVRDTPMVSPSLEIQDSDDFYTGWVNFNFLADAEVYAGFVSIAADIWIMSMENFNLGVRESGSAACFFFDLEFHEDGKVKARDSMGFVNLDSSYPTGRVIPIEIVFDMDADTYDLNYDGSLVLEDRAHGENGGCGVGSVAFGNLDDADYDGTYYVDNIEVVTYLFRDGFEAGDLSDWSIVVGGAK
jgi:hypothetical protein